KHVEGLTYEEISEVLGIGVSAAKMRVKRARDMLVELLGPSLAGRS
ncbi:MAG: RNA polymerase subunit sigma, partial [Deltaproteobacteria bacterium]